MKKETKPNWNLFLIMFVFMMVVFTILEDIPLDFRLIYGLSFISLIGVFFDYCLDKFDEWRSADNQY